MNEFLVVVVLVLTAGFVCRGMYRLGYYAGRNDAYKETQKLMEGRL